ncbi:MAG TPA: adenosylhomocysteinase [Gaiellaceae bacterium]|jgi:adenosylhomocysteinase
MGLGIEWVIGSCKLLAGIREEFERDRPFEGLRIGTGIHLEPKTVALLLTLASGGAEVVSTGNLNTTQQEAIDYLNAHGVRAIGGPTADPAEHDRWLRDVLATGPQLLLDNGGDLFTRWLEQPWEGLIGGTEETTSGRMRLAPLRDRIGLPVLVINDSPIKQFAENRHAVGQSTLESYLRITNRSTNGKRVTIFGYGACGRGVAAHFRNAFAEVSVVEIHPVTRLEALLDGFPVPEKREALERADVVITATGARDVVTAADLGSFADDTVLMNVGHFPLEIDVAGIAADPSVTTRTAAADGIETFTFAGGRRLHLLTGGHMANLAGPRPLGNSIESMDLGFALQARCLQAVANRSVGAADCVVPVPASIDAAVASAYIALSKGLQAHVG